MSNRPKTGEAKWQKKYQEVLQKASEQAERQQQQVANQKDIINRLLREQQDKDQQHLMMVVGLRAALVTALGQLEAAAPSTAETRGPVEVTAPIDMPKEEFDRLRLKNDEEVGLTVWLALAEEENADD